MVLDIDPSNSTFSDLRANGFLYVDKTYFLHRMITKGKMFFCARPRRFGKTLAVSTFEAIFQGKRELFKGLYIDSTDYDWKTYPVIHINFARCSETDGKGLDGWLREKLLDFAKKHHITLDGEKPSRNIFEDLLQSFQDHGEKVVILIDEYDRMISDNLDNPELPNLQQVLSAFYSTIKGFDSVIRFAFLTGVTKYAKLSVFSGMNNLNDLSMDHVYATMFGYTQEEVEQNFAPYIEQGLKNSGMDQESYMTLLKQTYDGYRFEGDAESVYNPVSIGKFFSQGGKTFSHYWVETGSTKLLLDVAGKVDFSLARDLKEPLDESDMANFDITRLTKSTVTPLELKWLLYQTGYLTIDHVEPGLLGEAQYYLDFPNREVESAFTNRLLSYYSENHENVESKTFLQEMFTSLKEDDLDAFLEAMKSLLAGLPYGPKPTEAFFQTAVDLITRLYDPRIVDCESYTSVGRIDMVFRMPKGIYLFEFKVDQSPDVALKQIHDKHYADRYKVEGKPIHLVGVSFSSKTRTIDTWKSEDIKH